MEDTQFAILVKMIESIDKKIDDFKFDVNRRFEQVDKQFEQVAKQFEQVAREFEQTRDLIKEEKRDREKMEEKLEKVYESRHGVEYRITRDFIFKNLAWNTLFILGAVVFIKIILL